MTKSVTRLYKQFQPDHYDITLDLDRNSLLFKGRIMIRGKKVSRPSQRLVFHQKGLKFESATILKHSKKGDQAIEVLRINTQNSFDEVRLHVDQQLYPGDYTVTLDFKGQISKPMNGIYPCYFKHNNVEKIIIATQFESHHAREAFPCIDEPEAKAQFDLTVVTPIGETVIANTPLKSQEIKNQKMISVFEPTPRMSSYLLAFAFGDLKYKQSKTKDGVIVRAYATPENINLIEFGLDVAVKALEFFGEYFGTKYPLSKLDMLALPDFSSGAMENWGLVTYRETTMLADPKNSSIETKQMVALVICHELSHQWFGNLVTMKWWDDLWLNESFANLMEYRAVDHIYPEWKIWEHFVSNESGSAKRRDSLADVQPIRTSIHHPDEISTLFDPSIVYAKGGTILHMLMHYIGQEAFRKGMQLYFSNHAYKNTVASDLWRALSQTSHQNIDSFMAEWLNKPGYPLVEIDWKPESAEVQISQKRFLSDPRSSSDTYRQIWQVPLAANLPITPILLNGSTQTITIHNKKDTPLLLNHEGQSYFLPYYSNNDHKLLIIKALENQKLGDIDRLLLIDNYVLLQRGGSAPTTELLDLLPAFQNEDKDSVWGSLAVALADVRKLIEGHEESEDILNKLIEKLVMPTVNRLTWDDSLKDSAQTLRLRSLALSLAASAKVKTVIDEGLKRFERFVVPSDIPATIRSVVLFIGARHGNKKMFSQLLSLHHECRNADEKEELASALTSTKSISNYNHLISLLTSDEIRRQDLLHWFVWLLRNRYSRAASWQWLITHWEWIEKQLSSDKSYSYFARYGGIVFSKPSELLQYQEFFNDKKSIIAMKRDIILAEQEISSRIAWRQRNEKAVQNWLSQY